MAEITNTSSRRGSGGRASTKNRSTKIDMTPMVDLAFLLLTFFILTTAFHKNRALEMDMPDPTGTSSPVTERNVLNLVLGKNDQIFWWIASEGTPQVTDYSKEGLRRVLLELTTANPSLIVLIKAHDEARFQNMVDILDEMVITGVSRFAIVDIADEDQTVLDLL